MCLLAWKWRNKKKPYAKAFSSSIFWMNFQAPHRLKIWKGGENPGKIKSVDVQKTIEATNAIATALATMFPPFPFWNIIKSVLNLIKFLN
jgi:hypothetical protein